MILTRILSYNLEELEQKKRLLPLAEMQRLALKQCPALNLASALRSDGIRLIAEVKKASPSRGIIRSDFNPVDIAKTYADNGAAAISILTEGKHFYGSLDHLKNIRKALPDKALLRKDFIVDPYQIYESRAYGADSLLLIVAILKFEILNDLLLLSHELGMHCLVEVHNESELEIALKSEARIIGINNRDLDTFNVDIRTTERLRPLIPRERTVVSESGIKSRADIDKLQRCGVDAILVGEYLMSAHNIGARMKELI
jgi:indole-3-glycerol phosphate synthase